MRIGIIGRGHVGAALGHALARAGHEVRHGVREPAAPSDIPAGTVAEVAGFADVLFLAVPHGVVQEVLKDAGDLDGKVLVDVTNAPKQPGVEQSSVEQTASFAPGARVVRAFNTVPAEVMANPAFPGGRASAFVCADDAIARRTVLGLAKDLGFEPVDAGPLKAACTIDRLLAVWMLLATDAGLGRNIAFGLLAR